MEKYDIIVVGGGASGLMAAGTAANNGAKVLLLEKMFRPGRKLRITGKGRCNLTNLTTIDDFLTHVNNPEFLKPAFENFFAQDLIDFLQSIHIKTKIERGQRVFPQSDKAQEIVDGLHKWVLSSGVELKSDARVNKLFTKEGRASGVRLSNGKMFFAEKVILCLGGNSYPKTGSTGDGYKLAESAGHRVTDIRPALVPIAIKGQVPESMDRLVLKNINVKVYRKNKLIGEKFGEMQFFTKSISGPIILSLSREFGKELYAREVLDFSIDLKPALSDEKLTNRIQREIDNQLSLSLKGLLRKLLPSQMVDYFIKILQIDPQETAFKLEDHQMKKIISLMKNFKFEVRDLYGFDEAVVTVGGVSLDEVDSKSMESKVLKNLYFAGELLDLDADTGGFNLQIAFSTGRLAAQSAIKK